MERHHSPARNSTTASLEVDTDANDKKLRGIMSFLSALGCMSSTRVMVLLVLCLQNSMFTVLRRYSLGVLHETYSKVREHGKS